MTELAPTAAATIGDDEVRRFVDDGYLVVPGLVGADDVAAGRAEALRFARGDYPVSNLPDLPEGASDDDRAASILAIHFPHWVSPTSLGLARHPAVSAVVSRIAGAHLAHWTGDVKCVQTMLFLKPPGLQGQAWHQDERFIPTRDRSLVGAWIALDDATIENGCLWVLPGSHRAGVLHPTRAHGRADEFDPTDESYGFDDTAAVAVEVGIGDVVFFNGYLLHRSMRNRSTRTRRAFVTHYMSAASNLPWMLSRTLDVGTADNRRVVLVAGTDPHAAKGYEDPPASTFVRPHTPDGWRTRTDLLDG